jgi:hypothetical protein
LKSDARNSSITHLKVYLGLRLRNLKVFLTLKKFI